MAFLAEQGIFAVAPVLLVQFKMLHSAPHGHPK